MPSPLCEKNIKRLRINAEHSMDEAVFAMIAGDRWHRLANLAASYLATAHHEFGASAVTMRNDLITWTVSDYSGVCGPRAKHAPSIIGPTVLEMFTTKIKS